MNKHKWKEKIAWIGMFTACVLFLAVPSWAGLVGGAGHHLHPLSQRVLELAAGYEAQNMGRIVPDITTSLFQCVLQFLQRGWKEEHGHAEERARRCR